MPTTQIKLASSRARATADALAVFLIDKKPASGGARKLPAGYAELDEQLGGALRGALARPEFSADRGAVTTLYPAQGYERVYVAGLGSAQRLDGNALRDAAGRVAREAVAAKIKSIRLEVRNGVDELLGPEVKGLALADGMTAAAYRFDRFKGAAGQNGDDQSTEPNAISVHVAKELREPFEAGVKIGMGVSTARELSATPPNVANPRYLVSHCQGLAKEIGMGCRVIEPKEAAELGLGGLLAVGRGGSTEPALIALEYGGKNKSQAGKSVGKKPKGKGGGTLAADAAPILIVGKAITFDTGGYSLKSTSGMQGMKYDKCGGMAVIGAMEAIARLEPDTPVVGLIPTAENMIDTNAYRVDDIITHPNGVNTEITNTDAEGRLVLADALAWGTKQYKPRAVLDLATLTGGVVVALGSHCAGLWCNDSELGERVGRAGETSGEVSWRLPLWDSHREQMKSNHADLCNSAASREAHPIQAAAFLSHFVGEDAARKMPELPWAHLDIAATAKSDTASAQFDRGPTGWGVRLLAELVRRWEG